MIAAFLLSLLWAPAPAQAYPEMVRHHYVNCNSCHVSPSGGGVLNDYGRGMASELLSTWSYESEALFLHGALKPEKFPSAVKIGGDVRALQVHRENTRIREGRYVLMQAQVEAAVSAGPVTAVAAYGKTDRQNHIQGGLGRFYLLAEPAEGFQIKAGRFLPSFGINLPHHTLPTRAGIGFGYDSDRNALEAHWQGELWHVALGASESRLNSILRDRERAGLVQVERYFLDSHRVGVSLWNGESDRQKRWLASAHGIFGFRPDLYLLTELAWQSKREKTARGDREAGLFQFGRLGYEITRGVHLLALQEFSKSDWSRTATQSVQFGAGALWYPRPHFEFELTFQQRRVLRTGNEFEDYAYLVAHYYL